MNEVLLSAGAASIILAVVGGGASAFGVQVPVLDSLRRQFALALVGVAFLAAAVLLPEGNGDNRTDTVADEDVEAYRQEVLAACRSMQSGGLPPQNEDGTFDRAAVITSLKSRLKSARGVLAELWERPVPDGLEDDAAEARRAVDNYLKRTRTAVDQLEVQLPVTVDLPQLFAAFQDLENEIRAPSARADAALSRLAGEPCGSSATGGTAG